ncbi:hypothetical protein [Glycomyces harbinensis]|uniref:Uncharacterized protein n=1 Tax=Glycomyces harbinensis TaxID=58114 RepID=A0A1G6Y8I7_9ACTN|nr:hypothetical protein [Glycomyces harbinensis]SDD86739.1 hypothetical protein SAMN05216270_108199 [Glycomyces harbinensis]
MDVPSVLIAISGSTDVLGIVTNPPPVDPTGGSEGVSFLISSAKYVVLIICGIVGVVAGALIAIGGASKRPDTADLGKKALLCSFVGIVVAGVWIVVTNTTWTFVS